MSAAAVSAAAVSAAAVRESAKARSCRRTGRSCRESCATHERVGRQHVITPTPITRGDGRRVEASEDVSAEWCSGRLMSAMSTRARRATRWRSLSAQRGDAGASVATFPERSVGVVAVSVTAYGNNVPDNCCVTDRAERSDARGRTVSEGQRIRAPRSVRRRVHRGERHDGAHEANGECRCGVDGRRWGRRAALTKARAALIATGVLRLFVGDACGVCIVAGGTVRAGMAGGGCVLLVRRMRRDVRGCRGVLCTVPGVLWAGHQPRRFRQHGREPDPPQGDQQAIPCRRAACGSGHLSTIGQGRRRRKSRRALPTPRCEVRPRLPHDQL